MGLGPPLGWGGEGGSRGIRPTSGTKGYVPYGKFLVKLSLCLSLPPPTLLPSLQRGSTTSLAIGSCSHCAHIRHARDTSRSPDVPLRLREHLKNTLCHVSADFPGHCVWLPLRPHSQDCGEWYRVHGAVAKVLGLLFAPALHLHHLHTQKFTYVRV